MRRLLSIFVLAFLATPLCGCAAQRPAGAEQAYIVNSQGQTAPTTRSALAGSTAPGKQELIGVYIPFVGTGLAIKAGLEYDGSPTVIEIPVGQAAPYAAPCAPQYVDEQVTEMVPETRMVPRTRTIRRAIVPIPRAVEPCAPLPQRTPGCAPPPSPVCTGPECGLDASEVEPLETADL